MAPDAVPEFLRATVSRMEDVKHDHHWIAVYIAGTWIKSGVADRHAAFVDAKLKASLSSEQEIRQSFAGRLIVGQHSGSAFTIIIAETYQEVRAGIWADLRRHLLGVGMILLAGIATINVVVHAGLLAPVTHLAVAARKIGEGEFGSQIDAIGIRELDELRTAFNGMSQKLADSDRNRATQMQTARLIQEHLLPKAPAINGFRIFHLFRPTEAIGGDYFDILPLKNGDSIVAVADASGHGVPAALVAAIVKVLLLDAAEHICDPAEILKFVDQRLTALGIPEAFVTMILVRISPIANHLEYASAGHISGWVFAAGSHLEALSATGPLLGAGLELGWETERIQFPMGSRLALLTDGVIEASLPAGDVFGERRVREVLDQSLAMTPQDALTALHNQLERHMQGEEFQDDVTLILIDHVP